MERRSNSIADNASITYQEKTAADGKVYRVPVRAQAVPEVNMPASSQELLAPVSVAEIESAQRGALLASSLALEQSNELELLRQRTRDQSDLRAYQKIQARLGNSAEIAMTITTSDGDYAAPHDGAEMPYEQPRDLLVDAIAVLNYDKPVKAKKAKKEKHERHLGTKQKLVLGMVGATAIAAVVGGSLYVTRQPNTEDTQASSAELAQEAKITSDKNPEVTAADISLADCDNPLYTAVVSGTAEYAPVITGEGANQKVLRFSQADKTARGLMVSVAEQPLVVTACVPDEKQRAAVVTKQGNEFTIDRSLISLSVATGISKKDDDIQVATIKANLATGLTEEIAATMNKNFANTEVIANLSTEAHALIASQVIIEGSAPLKRTEAEASAQLLSQLRAQVDSYYKQQGRTTPDNLSFLLKDSDYAAVAVRTPTGFDDIKKKTASIFKVENGQVDELKIVPTSQPAETAKPATTESAASDKK